MIKKISDFLAGWKMTLVGGIFLLFSLALLITKNFVELNISPFLDPAWITVVISGFPLIYLAISRLIKQRWVSSALLIVVAMIASLCIGELFAAGEVAFIMAIGSILEDKTTEKAKKGLNNLIKLRPTKGRVISIENGKETLTELPVEEIQVGSRVRILAGETIPCDGKIIVGTTSVNQSILTGESLPIDKGIGDEVFSGTLNLYGSIDIEATKESEDSSLQKMIRLMKDADNRKAPVQRLADKWATWLVPVAILIAVITGIVTYFTIGNENNAALIRAVTILVVFCPCALVLATPTAVMGAIGQATKYGVLIKSGEATETMGKVDTIAFDKTGTLTYGRLTVSDVIPLNDIDQKDFLSLLGGLEERSEHPLGKAIVSYVKKEGINLSKVSNFNMEAGKGVKALINQETYYCGNKNYLEENKILTNADIDKKLESLRLEGKVALLFSNAKEVIGIVALSDELREISKETVRKLKKLGYKVVLLTGDHELTAKYFAKQVGIDEIKAELLPEDKVKAIEELKKEGRKVCMIGDGVNDAPALKTADVGVSMSSIGSDIATEASSISLLNDDIDKLPYLCILAKATFRTIMFSITLSMVINFVAIVLSTLGLLNPITGALVHNAGSVFVVLIAALLYDRKFIKKSDAI